MIFREIFILLAMKDEIVPPEHMLRLFAKANPSIYKEKVNFLLRSFANLNSMLLRMGCIILVGA